MAASLVVLAALAGLTSRKSRLYTDSETLYRGTLERNPGSWLVLNNPGVICLERRDDTEAERLIFESLRLNPGYEAALERNASSRTVLLGLARTLAVSGDARLLNGVRAVVLAERAAQLTGRRDPHVLDVLASAYAESGRFGDAVSTAGVALDLARGAGLVPLAGEIENRLGLYGSGRPFHETGP